MCTYNVIVKIPALICGAFLLEAVMENSKKNKFDLRRIVGMAMFSALAYGVTFVFRIPVPPLTFDAKDAVLVIASFIYGPIASLVMSFIPAFIEFITISGTAHWGLIMNFASSACFSFTASLIYKYRKTFNGAIIGLYTAVVTTTLLMTVLNVLIMPVYQGVPREAVVAMLPTLIIPFNLAKTLMNSAITMLIYKPVSTAIKRAGLAGGKMDTKFNKLSVAMIITGALTLAVAIAVFVIVKINNA